ncbi:tubulin-tyrosine ligase family protein (macronuclear) [Tetrahymena thermophila SB210]|uniref:Tubulin-tyrosine ligase family protein n=1 Tax=Tetrahymena thermophila (strain SB210) TaxID=312017 RepID=Q23VB4_TETTS|nr:tubulin-tyrosine ligase family protein [Tetrahymena thermophila SB210]EAS00468.2 tubulin-tyrosine ligase family protein [Tetrahymena thermophila SB210]|eukprot:XP_001020713.2 tubulin-tyrosine ligase family protein [Tetrahymena thermophila SB210]
MSYFGVQIPKKPQTSEISSRKRIRISQKQDLNLLEKDQKNQKEITQSFISQNDLQSPKEIGISQQYSIYGIKQKHEKEFNRKNIFSNSNIQNDQAPSTKNNISVQKISKTMNNFFKENQQTGEKKGSTFYSPVTQILQPKNSVQINPKRNIYGYLVSPQPKQLSNIFQSSQLVFGDNKVFVKQQTSRVSYSTKEESDRPRSYAGYKSFTTLLTSKSRIEENDKSNNQTKAQLSQPAPYKFIIGKGNNSELVRKVMSKKQGWVECTGHYVYYNFNWQSVSSLVKFDRMKSSEHHTYLVNHFEFHREITQKDRLIKNISNYSKLNQINQFDITPLTFIFNFDQDSFDSEMEDFLSFFLSKSTTPAVEMIAIEILRRKNYYRNSQMKSSQILNSARTKISYNQVSNHSCLFRGKNIWIFKPSDTNRGRGIKLFNSVQQLLSILQEYAESTIPKSYKMDYNGIKKISLNRQFVIQKYIEQPLLINQRKFDIRMWAMMTYDFQVYIFKEGYIRTASEKYDLQENNFNDLIIHLTNNAIQKTDERYQKFEFGNQLSFNNLEKYFKDSKINCNFRQKILPKMKEYIVFTLDSIKNKINQFDRKFCFEIFGYDFVIDNQLNPWLIEVNTNPCLEESSPLLQQLIPRMLDDAFKLTVDKYFPVKSDFFKEDALVNPTVYKVDGYYDYENMWEQNPSFDYYLLKKKKEIKIN